MSQLVVNELTPQFRRADLSDIDGWFQDQLPGFKQIITVGQDLAVRLTIDWLIAHAMTAGLDVQPPPPTAADRIEADRQLEESLRVTGPVGLKKQASRIDKEAARRKMGERMGGSAQRQVLGPARKLTVDTIEKSKVIVGYRRVTSDSPCAFCAMLASRGPVYHSETSAEIVGSGRIRGSRDVGSAYHDNCHCVAEPVYSTDREPIPYAAEWQEAKALATEEGIRVDVAFRRIVEGRARVLQPTP